MDWTGIEVERREYRPAATIFSQGDAAPSIMYLERGELRLSVLSDAGKEAVVAVLGAGQFFGEGCMAGQDHRTATATTISPCSIVAVDKEKMIYELHNRQHFADVFFAHMLTRNIRLEQDLIDQLVNSIEKRLARALLLLAHYSEPQGANRVVPRVSQELLAEIVGTTRQRINFFMNRFRKLGFIDYNGVLTIHDSLLTVLMRN